MIQEKYTIDPLKEFGKDLLYIEKPGRYVGGEYGLYNHNNKLLKMAIAFPDLYEIGMSNQAIKILYNNLNQLEDVSCDRVFAPAPDFEKLLQEKKIPLYTLDVYRPLYQLDILGISLGYELCITGMLSLLQSGWIPLKNKDRTEQHPIIIIGGPAASNPIPFQQFVDAVWIGEAEDAFFKLIEKLRDAKREGIGRTGILEIINAEEAVWVPGKKSKRNIAINFSKTTPIVPTLPTPSIKVVQDHGTVEIMRGCPNGCRFCHAGIWYRPARMKSLDTIEAEVESIVTNAGYREITLSSLSSGDFIGINELVHRLNDKYKNKHISFQLPSLKVSTFSLPLLEQISETRKSGLTFAIETPQDAWQFSLNKEVTRNNVISILKEAKKHGWKSAKFYFMIGLPVGDFQNGYEYNHEEEEIVSFLLDVYKNTGVHIHVNIGTFVPKPHTPYQWVPQISEDLADKKLKYIRDHLRPLGFKISTHDPFVSTIEGLLSRGDERVGEIIEQAFRAGCRLDAWDDYFKKDIWKSLFEQHKKIVDEILAGFSTDSVLPWDSVYSGTSKSFLLQELDKSLSSELTSTCLEECNHNCGICGNKANIVKNSIHVNNVYNLDKSTVAEADEKDTSAKNRRKTAYKMVFSYSKEKTAIFIPHLSLVETFSKAFIRASLPVQFTEGFNPLPRLDIAAPLSLGVTALGEIATIELKMPVKANDFIHDLNAVLPHDIRITDAMLIAIPEGSKKYTSPSLLWGYRYKTDSGFIDIKASDDKKFRENFVCNSDTSLLDLTRIMVLADDGTGSYTDYFTRYRILYPEEY